MKSGFVHYLGWDHTYDEWLPAEDIKIVDAGDADEWYRERTNSFDYMDNRRDNRQEENFESFVIHIYKSFEEVVKHMTRVFLLSIVIIMIFVVLMIAIMMKMMK